MPEKYWIPGEIQPLKPKLQQLLVLPQGRLFPQVLPPASMKCWNCVTAIRKDTMEKVAKLP